MVRTKRQPSVRIFVLLIIPVLTLMGCPWGAMKYYPAETANVWMKDRAVCFSIPDSKDYQPVFISINLRSTPAQDRKFTDPSKLPILKGQLCMSPSFYPFPDTSKEPFIVEVALQSQDKRYHPRSFVTGFEMINGVARNVSLTTREYDVPKEVR